MDVLVIGSYAGMLFHWYRWYWLQLLQTYL